MIANKDCSTLEINGLSLELAYGFNELVDAEQITGCNLLAALENMGGGGNITAAQLRGLLFAMVTPYRGFPKEPLEQLKACGALIRIDTIGPIVTALGEACAIAVSQEYAEQYRKAMATVVEPVVAEPQTAPASEVVTAEPAPAEVAA